MSFQTQGLKVSFEGVMPTETFPLRSQVKACGLTLERILAEHKVKFTVVPSKSGSARIFTLGCPQEKFKQIKAEWLDVMRIKL